MTIPCATKVVAGGYPSSHPGSGYCYDGTTWYLVDSTVRNIVAYDFPAFSTPTTIYSATSGSSYFFAGPRFPTLDFQGFLYVLDYQNLDGTNPGTVDLVKIDLSDLSTTVLTSFPQDANVNSVSNLIYHPTTDSLWVIVYESINPHNIPSFAGEIDYLVEVDKVTGTQTIQYTATVNFPGGVDGLQGFQTMTTTPDAIWGGSFDWSKGYAFRWDVNTASMTFGLQSVHAAPPGVGTKSNAVLMDLKPGAPAVAAYEVDSSFGYVITACGYPTFPIPLAGTSRSGWSRSAWVKSPDVWELTPSLGGFRVGGVGFGRAGW